MPEFFKYGNSDGLEGSGKYDSTKTSHVENSIILQVICVAKSQTAFETCNLLFPRDM